MSRTQQPQEMQQAAGDKSETTSVYGIVPSSLLPSESKQEKKAEVAMQGTRNPELDRFLRYRARLEFAELLARRERFGEGIEEEEELEREVRGGRRRNVGRFSGLGGWGDLGGRREGGGGGGGGGGVQRGGDAVGSDGSGGGDGSGNRERSWDLVLPQPPLQLELRCREFCGGGVRGHAEAEMDGLRGRIRRLTGGIREVGKVVEEKREREEEARSVLVFDEKDWDGRRLPDTYFPSSPILSSLYPAKERRKTGSRRWALDPQGSWIR